MIAVAHFPASLAHIKQELWNQRIPYIEPQGSLTAAEVRRYCVELREADVLCVLGQNLAPSSSLDLAAEQGKPLSMLVAERHFLRAKDEHIVDFAAALQMPSSLTFHLSLDDPLLKAFAGDWVKTTLGRLGMQESESIVSHVVAKRIRKAQDRLAEQAIHDWNAESAEEWLQLNLPNV